MIYCECLYDHKILNNTIEKKTIQPKQYTIKMSLLLITGSTLLGAVLLLIIMKPKKLHVEVEPMKMKVMGINIWPLLVTMNNLMPEGMRKNAVTKQNAPKPGKIVKDLYDLNGTSPYKTEKIVPGKVWEIIYIHENTGRTDADAKKQMKDFFGLDPKCCKSW